eukprot:59866-Pelagomonas_calceolata.AAC.1
MANKKLGQVSTAPSLTANKALDPIGAGIANTISQAELAGVGAAFTQCYSHLASDSLTSFSSHT